MAALLLNIRPGDEVIVPAFTFPSAANAFVLRGARPVFVDIRADTLNIDENQIEQRITERDESDFSCALRGCRMRNGHDHGRSRAGMASRWSKITHMAFMGNIADDISARLGSLRLSVSMRPKISRAEKAARC